MGKPSISSSAQIVATESSRALQIPNTFEMPPLKLFNINHIETR